MPYKICESCGMPMKTADEYGRGDINNPRCKYCVNPDGTYKKYEEVQEGTIQALMRMDRMSRQEAERKAKMLDNLPAWKNRKKC